jgi:CheY-like chemotaxis protein
MEANQTKTEPSQNGKLVLIVDDKPEILKITSAVLTHYGYTTVEAKDGYEAKTLFESFPIDLVVTDIYMPLMDGLTLIGELKLEDPDARIIAMSGNSGIHYPECMEWAKALGASFFLEKPFEITQLIDMVEIVLHESGNHFHNA